MSTLPLLTVATLALLLWQYWLWRAYRIEELRQALFAARDQLFDLGASGEVPFDHAAHRLVRNMINGHIRFAHRMTVGTVLIHVMGRRPASTHLWDGMTFGEACERANADLSVPTREKLGSVITSMHWWTVRHLLLSSLTLYFVASLLVFGGMVARGLKSLMAVSGAKATSVPPADRLDSIGTGKAPAEAPQPSPVAPPLASGGTVARVYKSSKASLLASARAVFSEDRLDSMATGEDPEFGVRRPLQSQHA